MEICIDTKDVKTGMIITRTVYNSKGKFIISSNTTVTDSTINKLRANRIKTIYVTLDDPEFSFSDLPPEIIEGMKITNAGEQDDIFASADVYEEQLLQELPPEKQEEFKQFAWDYSIKEKTVKDALLSAVKGQTDLEKINETSTNLMSSLRVKSDLLTYLNRIKIKDTMTFSHSLNVSLLCNLFGGWLNLSEPDLNLVTSAGMLHDIGKTQIDDIILNKPGKLSDKEFEIMKSHTVRGYRILEPQDINNEIKLAALMHHEKLDGTGYPIGANPEKISKVSRIVAICDIYEAMVADRVYRQKIIPFEVIDKFQQTFFGKLDTSLMMIFLENIAQTYCNSIVELSDGSVGEIVFINKLYPSRPVINVNGDFIDLSRENLEIVKLF